MTNETQDPRALLAKMDAELQAAREKVDKLEEENSMKRAELLSKLRDADLEDVKTKCKLHGFTVTQLRSALKKQGGARKSTLRKSAVRETEEPAVAARKTATTRRKKQVV